MIFYNDPENVESYIRMADGYDGRELIDLLRLHLPEGSTVLELGMGPGKDLEMLAECYSVTGSDHSSVFIDRYRKEHPNVDLLQLDAHMLETERTFDCIYSNKVLHHLSRAHLQESLSRQATLLRDNGLLCHSFWYGEHEEEMQGMTFVYYTEESLLEIVNEGFEVIDLVRTTEMEENDTLFLLLRKVFD